MKSWQKLTLILLTILILIIVGISFLVKSYLVPQTIELLVIPKLEEIIKHTISFKKIDVSLTGTIELKDISIYDPTLRKETVFFQSQGMVLHCRLLPLLSKNIIIDEITLHQPHIDLTRDKDGNYNFIKDTPEATKNGDAKGKTDTVLPETTLSFIVTQLNVKNGELTFTDYLKTSSPPFKLTLKNINIRASDFSLVSPFPLNLSAEIVSTPPSFLKLKALIDPLLKEVESKVQITPLDTTQFTPYFSELPFTLLKGYCSLDLTITANRSLDFSSQGLISLSDFTLSSANTSDDEPPDTFIDSLQNITVDLNHRLSYKSSSDTLLLEKCDATIQKVKLSLVGKIETCKTDPFINLTVKTEKLPAQNILDSLPQDFMPGDGDFSSSGTTGANLSIKVSPKNPEDLEINGYLLIDKLKIKSRQIPHCKTQIDGKILFNGHDITIEHLKTTFQNFPLTLKGRINNYLQGPLTAELNFTSPSLVIDDIISCMEEVDTMGETAQEEDEEEEREEMEPFNFNKAKIKADISINRISYKNIHISDVKARCSLDDNKFHLESLKGAPEGGSLQLKGLIDLSVNGLEYNLQLAGDNLQLNPIITSFAPDLQENIHGITDLTINLRGSGTTSDTFKKHLKGEGNIHIENGKISGLESLQSFASFIKVGNLGTLSFDQSQGTFKITDGLVHTESSLKGKEVELYPKGTISLDSYLDLSLEMRLSPQLSEQIANEALTKYFKDERGWTVLTLAIKGPTDEVVVMPASSTIKNISEMIIDILLKKEEDIDSDKRQDKKKALENLIKGLIKKSKEDAPHKSSQ